MWVGKSGGEEIDAVSFLYEFEGHDDQEVIPLYEIKADMTAVFPSKRFLKSSKKINCEARYP